MKNTLLKLATLVLAGLVLQVRADNAQNPIIQADVPDMAMIRVGDTYYMSSTTMHMSPGLPIMKSKDLVNWQGPKAIFRTPPALVSRPESQPRPQSPAKEKSRSPVWSASLRAGA